MIDLSDLLDFHGRVNLDETAQDESMVAKKEEKGNGEIIKGQKTPVGKGDSKQPSVSASTSPFAFAPPRQTRSRKAKQKEKEAEQATIEAKKFGEMGKRGQNIKDKGTEGKFGVIQEISKEGMQIQLASSDINNQDPP